MPYTRTPPTGMQLVPSEMSYTTNYGWARTFKISIAYPDTGPADTHPLVVFSHGGAGGAGADQRHTTEWARVWADHGYIVVMITHTEPDRDAGEIDAITRHLHLGTGLEDSFKVMNYLRLFDIDHVVANLSSINATLEGANAPVTDPSAGFALAGHSAGSAASLTHAGATRFWGGCGSVPYRHTPARAATCHLAFSIQGPDEVDHLCTGSWATIPAGTPVLAVTGAGDGDDPPLRRLAYAEMRGVGHSKYAFWLRDPSPKHPFYNHKNTARHTAAAVWMEDVTLAFLDHYLKGDTGAALYLDSDAVVADSAGMVQWSKR